MRTVCCSLSFSRNRISFRFKMISATSSVTPGTVENSCKMPLMRTATIEAPMSEESIMRRSELPMVWPKPRSNGSA